MMNKQKISIIIPIYNAVNYIEQCIGSIIEQKDENIEIILINDGSSDNSELICKKYLSDNRFKYVYIENNGVSNARNCGIELASGEWILFVDSDDKLMPESLKKIRNALLQDTDILYCNYLKTGEMLKFSEKQTIHNPQELVIATLDYLSSDTTIRNSMIVRNMLFTPCWGKIYKRSIIIDKNIRFSCDLKLSEDMYFNFLYLKECNQVTMFDFPIYYYYVNPKSVTHNYKVEHLYNRRLLIEKLLNSNYELGECIGARNQYILSIILQNMDKVMICENREEAKLVMQQILNMKEVEEIIKKNKYVKLSLGKFQDLYYKSLLFLLKKKQYQVAMIVGNIYYSMKNK